MDIVCTAVHTGPQVAVSMMVALGTRHCARRFVTLFACAALTVLYNDRRSGLAEATFRSQISRFVGRRVQRIEQHINGRLYYIELSQVQRHRWRAHVVTAQGAPTALMSSCVI